MKSLDEALLEEVTIEDVTETQKDLVKAIGMEAFIQGCREIGGGPWYFPTVKNLIYSVKKKKVLEEYNGNNIKKLAAKYDISDSSIYRIIEEGRSQKK